MSVINAYSTDCPFCLVFFLATYYSFFPNTRNFPVFNSLTKRNGEDEAQLEHNIMKLVVASSLESVQDFLIKLDVKPQAFCH